MALPGRVFRYTTAPESVTVTNKAGDSFLYLPGMDPVTLERTPDGVSSVGVSVFSSELDSWPKLAARKHRFELMRCTIRHWFAGMVLEEAEVYIRGRATGVAIGTKWDPITFTVERQLRRSGVLPIPAMRIDDQTFTVATIDEKIYGASMPIVVGRPGDVSGSVHAAVSPAYLVLFTSTGSTSNRWLIAGHEVQATTVALYDIDAEITATRTVATDTDDLGRVYSYVTSVAGFGAPTTNEGNEFRIAWDQGGGGVYNDTRTADRRGAGEVLRWLLQTWAPGIDLDVGRMKAYEPILNAYKLDFAITTPVEVWTFIQSNILPILPVDVVEGSGGLYFQPRRLWASAAMATAHLNATEGDSAQNCSQVGVITTDGDIFNRITVKFGRGGQDQRQTRAFTVDAKPDSSNTRVLGSYRCAQSQLLFGDPFVPGSGVRPLEVTTAVVYDEATAAKIAKDMATELAMPRRYLTVMAAEEWNALDVNDVLTITNDDMHLSAEVAVVRAKRATSWGVEIDLQLVESPYDANRLTS